MDKQPQDSESRHADKFIVRFPDGMRDRIAAEAKTNGRTMNAEIVARLQASFDPAASAGGAAAQELADSRGQTLRQVEFLQGSLCESIEAMFAALQPKDRRDRTFSSAQRLASSLLAAVRPGDYQRSRAELLSANPALATFLQGLDGDIAAQHQRENRGRRSGVSKP